MTSLYDIFKANRLGMDSDPWIAILGEAWKASEEEYKEYTGLVPYTFIANGQPLIDWTIIGNMSQTGTPTPQNPIQPSECGELETSGAKAGQYKIPISSANTTTNVYLGEVQSTRKIKKLVIDGTEGWIQRSGDPPNVFFIEISTINIINNLAMSTHYINQDSGSFSDLQDGHFLVRIASSGDKTYIGLRDSNFPATYQGARQLEEWFAQQYANGTPVCVWYVIANPETAVVNEPLRKIGNYADILTATQAGIEIPTNNGSTTLDIDTTLKPSEVYIKYKGR